MTFQIQPRGGLHPHLPVQLLDGNQTTTDFETFMDDRYAHKDSSLWDMTQPMLCNYFIPPFQRPLVWSQDQKVRFIESALLGLHLGSIVVVDAMNCPMPSKDRFAATDRWLLDGQQRLSAIAAYRDDEITVFSDTDCEHRWSDLGVVERRKVWHIQMGVFKVATDDVDYCREVYNRLNFGGTPHESHQKA